MTLLLTEDFQHYRNLPAALPSLHNTSLTSHQRFTRSPVLLIPEIWHGSLPERKISKPEICWTTYLS